MIQATGIYSTLPDVLLQFMRQQRCGYNPFFDAVCHQADGRVMDGPMPDSTYIDVSGGWHDAGDQLKYLITGSNATARMIMAYQMSPASFDDKYNALGQSGANHVPDVLDEAKWGLDWILKLHPASDQLIHQVADDRDHLGWKFPMNDPSNYGWGKNSYRVAYYATGKPQGLHKYKSQATGIANLAGRSAAALALGYQVWNAKKYDPSFAMRCLQAAEELYAMAKNNPGISKAILMELHIVTMKIPGLMIWNGPRPNCIEPPKKRPISKMLNTMPPSLANYPGYSMIPLPTTSIILF